MSLHGVRVAVTRPAAQASELMRLLQAEGARVSAYPLIRIQPNDPLALADALVDRPWDWVVFTSPNAVRLSAAALEQGGEAALASVLAPARIACVGPATADAARQVGLVISVLPDEFTGAGVGAAITAAGQLAGARVLWPRGEAAADTVAANLGAAGAEVTAPVAYRTLPDRTAARELARATLQGDLDVVTFTSPSAVRSLAAEQSSPAGFRVVAIGPVTADAARAAGYRVDAVAAEHTSAGVVEALRELYR